MNVGINTVLLFDSTDTNSGQPSTYQSDPDLSYDSVTNPGRFTYTGVSPITLVVSWQVGWQAQNSGSRATWISINGDGGNRYGFTTVQAGLLDVVMSGTAVLTMSNGDYLDVYGLQTSSSPTLATGGDAGGSTLGRTNRIQLTRI